jgi:hypothetical protein
MKTVPIIALLITGYVVVGFIGFAIGANRTVARGAYVQSIVIQEEAKCLATKDIDCLRIHWLIRASSTAETASRALGSVLPAPMSEELQAYLNWVNARPEIRYPAQQ